MNIRFIYNPIFFKYALRLTGNEEDAKDLIQDAAILLIKSKYDNLERVAFKVIHNRYIDDTIRNGMQKRNNALYEKTFVSAPSVFDKMAYDETLNFMLRKRKKKFKMVLAAAMGFSASEIAEGLGVEKQTLTPVVCHARKELRKYQQ